MRTTLDVTIQRDIEPVGRRVFSKLVEGPGEPHQWRDDLGVLGGSADVSSSADSAGSDATKGNGLPRASEFAAGLPGVAFASLPDSSLSDSSVTVSGASDSSLSDSSVTGSSETGSSVMGSSVMGSSEMGSSETGLGVSGLGTSVSDRLVGARALLRLVHITDTQVIDASSPARAEFVELAAATDSRWDIMVPMFRPHELLQQHALAAMVETINALDVAPISGERLDVVIVTGDCVDNAQRNELNAYLALLDGGSVCLPYDGVQSVAACTNALVDDPIVDSPMKGLGDGDTSRADELLQGAGGPYATETAHGASGGIVGRLVGEGADGSLGSGVDRQVDSGNGGGFWCPDPSVDDHWKRAYGFPSYPGLLEAIDSPVVSPGLKFPWLGVVGNHDWLRQGTAKTSAALEAIAVGSQKATGIPSGFLPEDALVAYLEEPASYNVGAPTRRVRADPDRVAITSEEFIRAHIESEGRVAALEVTAFSGNPIGPILGLDMSEEGDRGIAVSGVAIRSDVNMTAATRGHGFGADVNVLRPDYVADFGAVRIIAIDTNHPAGHYQGSVGLAQLAWLEERLIEAKDVYILLASHHPTEALTNETKAEGFVDDRVLADPVAEVLHRHPCVIGWLTGHRHRHSIKACRDPLGTNPGFGKSPPVPSLIGHHKRAY